MTVDTDLVLDWGSGKGYRPNALSIDKISPEKGYIKGNVVLCTYKSNTIKTNLTLDEIRAWLPGWHKRILEFLEWSNTQCSEASSLPHAND